VIAPDDRADRKYLYHYLRCVGESGGFHTVGTTRESLNIAAIRRLGVPLPSLPVQKRIAAILDAADALRAKRRESIEQLDSLVQTTFLEMFGDPVTNPKGWPQVELATLIAHDDRINYGVVQPGDDCPQGRPLIRVGDFAGGVLDTSNVKMIAPHIESRYARSRLKGDELLVSCVGSIGTVCEVTANERGFNIARAVARVPLGTGVNREFVMHCLRSSAVQHHFAKETRTVSQPTLNIALIKTAPIVTPPLDLQTRFASIVESIEQQKVRLKAHLAELDTLFASLQSRAFNGELVL
jgi:type I restriction enzyme S subunit